MCVWVCMCMYIYIYMYVLYSLVMESPFLKCTGNILQDRSLSYRSHKPNLGKLKKKEKERKKEKYFKPFPITMM